MRNARTALLLWGGHDGHWADTIENLSRIAGLTRAIYCGGLPDCRHTRTLATALRRMANKVAEGANMRGDPILVAWFRLTSAYVNYEQGKQQRRSATHARCRDRARLGTIDLQRFAGTMKL